MNKTALWILGIIVVLVAGFYALNGYIRHQELNGGTPGDKYEGWTASTTPAGTYYYPEELGGTYYSAAEWPPKLTTEATYSCEVGQALGLAISEETRDGITYCRTISAEGAAGSTYKTYEYQAGMHKVIFTLRFPQCLNYDEPNQSACHMDQESLDVDALALRILGSVR